MKVETRVDSSDFDEAISNLIRTMDSVATDELRLMAARVKKRAQAIAPYNTGRLKRGIRYRVQRGSVTFTASAINPRTGYDYALDQHENESYQHTTGEAKFLFKAIQEEMPEFIREVTRKIANGTD